MSKEEEMRKRLDFIFKNHADKFTSHKLELVTEDNKNNEDNIRETENNDN